MSEIVTRQVPSATGDSRAGDSSSPTRQCAQAQSKLLSIRAEVPRAARFSAALASFVMLFGAYVWLSTRPWVSEAVIPTVRGIVEAGAEILQGSQLWVDVEYSFLRVAGGFLLAAGLALPLGIASGSYRLVQAFCEPIAEFLRYIPVPALVPLVMIIAGIDEGAKILLIFLGTFFQLLVMTSEEVRRVPMSLVQVSQTMGANRREIVTRVLMPAASPGIWTALRLCHGWAWSYVVVAELLAATEGLGFRVLRLYRFMQTPSIYVYLVILGIIGLSFDWAFRAYGQRRFHWAQAS